MKNLYFLILLFCGFFSANATDYLVSSNNYTVGEKRHYQQRVFEAGTTHFQTIDEVLNKIQPGDNIYLAPGTYANDITLNVSNISIFGNNSYKDVRSNTRDTSNESIISGTIYINAHDITINGLKITGEGRIVNTTAAYGSPIKNITLEYNLVEASTLNASTPVISIGAIYRDTNAKENISQLRYENVKISHNDFNGENTNYCPFIQIAGGYGNIIVHDNKFTDGGTSIEIANSRGNITVTNNKFQKVGQSLYNPNATTVAERGGAFCINLSRNSMAGTTNINVSHNGFNKCTGRNDLFALIRYFQGDKNDESSYVVPVGASAKINHNVFLNKTTYSDDNYNYVLYCNNGYMGDVTIDARYNYFDNSDMCMGHIKMPGKTEQERFFSSSFGFYDFREGQNVTRKQVLKEWENYRSNRVAQSFDVSEYDFDEYGEPYYYFNHIQELGEAQNTTTYGCPEAQLITRVYYQKDKNGDKEEKRAHMDVAHAGHGSNMSTFRHEGDTWICFGGNGTISSDGKKCHSNGITFFPYNSANLKADNPSKVDCSEGSTSFTDINKKSHPIYHFTTDNELNDASWYNHFPAIDETSRYLAVLSRKSGGPMCVEVYHLDDVLNHVMNGAARPSLIKSFQIAKGADPDNNIPNDKGFWGWDHQGFTISGDYIYFMEGVGAGNDNAIDNKPTVIFHAYNWRTGKSYLRRQVLASEIMSMSHGEPEGVKIRRAKNGRPFLYLSIADGPSGDRNMNLIRYSNLYKGNGFPYGIDLPLSKGKTAPGESSLTFSTSSSETKTITLSNTYLKGDMSVTIAGENAEYFSVTSQNINALSDVSTLTVTYKPINPTTANHSAVIRISSTYADDVIIPLTATYTGVLTGTIDNVTAIGVKKDASTSTKTIDVNWNAPNNGIALSYDVQYKTTQGNWTSLGSVPSTNYTYTLATDAQEGEIYTFNIIPKFTTNETGAGTESNCVTDYIPSIPVDIVTTQQVIDGKYSFNLVVDATINNTNIAKTTCYGTNAIDLAKYYIVKISDELANITTSVTDASGNLLTISDGSVAVAENGVISTINGKYVQVEASATDKSMPSVIFHNVNPQATYSIDVYLGNTTAETEMNAAGWTYLKFQKASSTSSAMTMPGVVYSFGNAVVATLDENPVSTSPDDMPMGTFLNMESDQPTNAVTYNKANYITTTGGVIDALCVTDEVLDNWVVKYDLDLIYNDNKYEYDNIPASNVQIPAEFSYLPFNISNDEGADKRGYTRAIDTEYLTSVDVNYTRNNITSTIKSTTDKNKLSLTPDQLFPSINNISHSGVLLKRTSTHFDLNCKDTNGELINGGYYKTYYDAAIQLSWDVPSPYHLIGYYANAIQDEKTLICAGHYVNGSDKWIQYVAGSVISDEEISKINTQILKPIGYNGSNNWAELAAEGNLPLLVHYVFATNENEMNIYESAVINIELTADYPILVKDKPVLNISNVATADESLPKMLVVSSTPESVLQVSLNKDNITTGVDEIIINNNGNTKYYNLQGVEVVNPSKGVFIKVEGNKASKVVIK